MTVHDGYGIVIGARSDCRLCLGRSIAEVLITIPFISNRRCAVHLRRQGIGAISGCTGLGALQRHRRQRPYRRRGRGRNRLTVGICLGDNGDRILSYRRKGLGVRGYPGSATVPRVGGDIGAAVCGQSDGRAVASGSIINSDHGHGVHRDGQGSGFALAVVAVDVRHIEGGGLAHREGGAGQGLGSVGIGVPFQRAAISRGGRQGNLLSTAQGDGLSGRCGRHLIQRHLRRGEGGTTVGVLHRDGLGNLSVNALQCKSGLCSSSITLEIILAGIVNPGVGGHIGGNVCRGEGRLVARTNRDVRQRHRRLGVHHHAHIPRLATIVGSPGVSEGAGGLGVDGGYRLSSEFPGEGEVAGRGSRRG